MKTKEELNALREEVDTLNRKLAELTEEELAQVAGGLPPFLVMAERGTDIPEGMFDGCPELKPKSSGLPATAR